MECDEEIKSAVNMINNLMQRSYHPAKSHITGGLTGWHERSEMPVLVQPGVRHP